MLKHAGFGPILEMVCNMAERIEFDKEERGLAINIVDLNINLNNDKDNQLNDTTGMMKMKMKVKNYRIVILK